MLEHLVSLADHDADRLRWLLGIAAEVQQKPAAFAEALAGRSLDMVFAVPATRARLSFQVAMQQLGGEAMFVPAVDLGVRASESPAAAAEVLSCFVDGIVASLEDHAGVVAMAAAARVPLLNGGSGLEHPCQALADLLALKGKLLDLPGRKIAWVGPAAPVLHSLLLSAPALGADVTVATPDSAGPDRDIVAAAQQRAGAIGAVVQTGLSPAAAVDNADVVYASPLGSDAYRVDAELMSAACNDAVLLHQLPASIDAAVAADVPEQVSLVREQAEMRLPVQKALLLWVLGVV